MKRFYLVFSLCVLLVASCSSQMHYTYRANPEIGGNNPVIVYVTPPIKKKKNYDLQLHDFDVPYVIIRKDPKVMEICYPTTMAGTISHGVLGEWRQENDTLLFIPRTHYRITDAGEYISKGIELNEDDHSFMEVPQYFLAKRGSLVDITDYSYLSKEVFGEDYKEKGNNVFVLIK